MPVYIDKDTVVLFSKFVRVYENGAVIFRRGEPAPNFYIVLSGQVQVGQQGQVHGPGSLLGVEEFIRRLPRPQTAFATQKAHLALLNREALAQLSHTAPEVARHLFGEIRQVLAGPRKSVGVPAEAEGVSGRWISMHCPVCTASFENLWISSRYFEVASRDSDFGPHYRHANGLVYAVIVCPHCGFAAYRDSFAKVMREELPALQKYVSQHPEGRSDLTGQRTLEQGLQSFYLALGCYQVRPPQQARLARLYHHLAWLYRELGDHQQEEEYLRRALQSYEEAYLKGTKSFTSQLGEPGAIYLIGELHYRLGDIKEAVRWLEKAFYHPQIKQKPFVQNLVRERWLEIRNAVTATPGVG